MKRITINLLFSLAITALLSMQAQAADMVDLPDSCEDKGMNIIVCPLDDGIDMDDAIDSMKLRANSLNFKLVAVLDGIGQAPQLGHKLLFGVGFFDVSFRFHAHSFPAGCPCPRVCLRMLAVGRVQGGRW